MGKIDDMRRQREQKFADAAGAGAGASTKKSVASSTEAAAEQGKCPDCGKTKPVSNGVLANHQKGFGKACAGSRKKPL